jgi:hypothetical protein
VKRIRRNPRPFVLAGVAVAVLGGFFVVVAPLFNAGGAPTAELAGAIPAHAHANAPVEIDVGLDNTGTSLLRPVCVQASVSGPLTADHAVFQGLDTVPFRGGTACGGALGGQETISIKLYLRPSGTGTASVAFTPSQGDAPLGGTLSGSIQIENP